MIMSNRCFANKGHGALIGNSRITATKSNTETRDDYSFLRSSIAAQNSIAQRCNFKFQTFK